MMMTLREYFEREADACIARIAALDPHAAGGDARAEAHRAARELRGVAQLAREDAVQRAARAVEKSLRPGAAVMPAGSELAALLDATVAELHALVRGGLEEAEADARADALAARWTGTPAGASAGDGAAVGADVSSDDAAAAREFAAFAAREVGAIAAALEAALVALAKDPLDREPIETTLRRQRALLGAARLSEVPIVAETLRAVEDLAQVITRLDVGVKGEWLDVFRSARDVLTGAAGALYAGTEPQPSHGLSRLRTLRQELLDRYGAAVESDAAGPRGARREAAGGRDRAARAAAPSGGGPAAADASSTSADEEAIVDVAVLCYDREAALRRAMELRGRVERAIGDDADARDAVDEVFDLLRIALG